MQIKFNGVTRIENQLLILPKKINRGFEFPKNMIAQYGAAGGKQITCLGGGNSSGSKKSSSGTRETASPRGNGSGGGNGGDDGSMPRGVIEFEANALNKELLDVLYKLQDALEKNIVIFRYLIDNDYLDSFRELSMLDMAYDSLYEHLESLNNINLCIGAVKIQDAITKNAFELGKDLKFVIKVGARALDYRNWLISSAINFSVLKSDLGLLTQIMSDIEVAIEYSRFAMSMAVIDDNEKVVEFLLNFGLDFSFDDFIEIAKNNRSYKTVKLLSIAKDSIPRVSGE